MGGIADEVLTWLESVRFPRDGWGRWKYHSAMTRNFGLQACGIAVGLLHELDALRRVEHRQRQEAVSFLQSCQDPSDGYFKDPLVTEADRVPNAIHSWEHIWNQVTGGVVHALDLLGATPLHRLPTRRFADLSADPEGRWVLELDWRNPWLVGEQWDRAIEAYAVSLGPPPLRADAAIEQALTVYEREVLDGATGMPNARGCADLAVAMCGLFKTAHAYLALGRPVPHATAAIDSVLGLQRETGEFGLRGNMCMNWDAAWLLLILDRQLQGSHRHGDILTAGRRLAGRLMEHYRKSDGGFAFCGTHCWTVHNSVRLGPAAPVSDMSGTSMAVRCLSYLDEWERTPS
jgi:hypothetical protein